jgi:hypothetical protein
MPRRARRLAVVTSPVFALTLLAAPLAAEAQIGTVPRRIGLLDSGSLAGRTPLWEEFRQGMRELECGEGRTVTFEARAARFEALAASGIWTCGPGTDAVPARVAAGGTAAVRPRRRSPRILATSGLPVGSSSWPAPRS